MTPERTIHRPSRSTRGRTILLALLAAMALLVAACSSSDSGGSAEPAPDADTPTTEQDDGNSDDGEASDDPLAPQPLAEKEKLTVTLPVRLEGFGQVLLADHFGEFEKENLDVELATMPGNEAITLLTTGRADAQLGGPSAAFFNARNAGADLIWAASNYIPSDESLQGLWLNDDLLTDGEVDPDKLRESTIALGTLGRDGTVFAYEMADWLAEMDMTLDDFDEALLTGADTLVALESGAIDGGMFLDPYWLELDPDDGYTRVLWQKDSHGGIILGSSRHEKAEALEAFFRAILRTNRDYLDGDYHADPEVLSALSTVTEIPEDDLARTPSLIFVQDLWIDPEVATKVHDLWFERGLLEASEPEQLDDWVDQSIVDGILGD